MNYKIILFIFFLVLTSCETTQNLKKNNFSSNKNFFINKGFALIYEDNLNKNSIIEKKMEVRGLVIFQKNLKRGTDVKVTNLINQKYIIAKVGKKSDYPSFYNSVVSDRISKEIEINKKEPYIEIKEIVNNSSFVAQKSKTFDEEKNVASKAPVDEIKIKDLSGNNIKTVKKTNNVFRYIIKIGDFYFEESANAMALRIKNETSIKKVSIVKLSSTNFRVFLGPFKNLSSLKNQFNAINTLQFDNIEILKK